MIFENVKNLLWKQNKIFKNIFILKHIGFMVNRQTGLKMATTRKYLKMKTLKLNYKKQHLTKKITQD